MQKVKSALWVTILIIAGLTVLYLLYLLQPVWKPFVHAILWLCVPFLVAAFISFLLHPVVERVHRMGIHRGVTIVVIYALFFGGVGAAIYFGLPIFYQQLTELVAHVPEWTESYRNGLITIHEETQVYPDGVQAFIDKRIDAIETFAVGLVQRGLSLFAYVSTAILFLALIPFISFYLLKDFDVLKGWGRSVSPHKWKSPLHKIFIGINDTLGGYIRGQFIVCVLIGIIATIALMLLDIKFSIVLGVFIGLTNIIPYFGPVVGAIPTIAIAATMSWSTVIWVIVLIVALQFLEGNVLSPWIVGKSVHLHPLVILALLLVAGELAGLVGLLLVVPLFAVVRVIYHVLMDEKNKRAILKDT